MFCPKCGLQNADGTKFCRGCGADLSNILAAVDGKLPETRPLSEKHIDLFSSGTRNLMIGVGFFIVSAAAFAISIPNLAFVGLCFLAMAFYGMGTGISRLIQAKGLKSLNKGDEHAALTPGQTEYVGPSRSIYETDDLIALPPSVTENTTTHLEMDPGGEKFSLPKK